MTIIRRLAAVASVTTFAFCALLSVSLLFFNSSAAADSTIAPTNHLHYVQQSSLSTDDYLVDYSIKAELARQRLFEIDVMLAVLMLHEIAGRQWEIGLLLDVSAAVEQVNRTSKQLQRVVDYDVFQLPGQRERAAQIAILRRMIAEEWKEYFALSEAVRKQALAAVQPSLLEVEHALHASLCTQPTLLVSNKPEAALCQ